MIKALRPCPCCKCLPELKRCGYSLFYGCANDEPIEHDFAGGLCQDPEEAAERWNISVETGWFDKFMEEEEVWHD